MPERRTKEKQASPSVAAAAVQASEQVERRSNGTFAKGARTAQSQGGRALKERTALSHGLGLGELDALPAFAPYRTKAKAFHRAYCADMAKNVGKGKCGPGPSAIALSASFQQAASLYWFDQAAATGDANAFQLGSRLADSSRQNLAAAHELSAKEAAARVDEEDPIAELLRGMN